MEIDYIKHEKEDMNTDSGEIKMCEKFCTILC